MRVRYGHFGKGEVARMSLGGKTFLGHKVLRELLGTSSMDPSHRIAIIGSRP